MRRAAMVSRVLAGALVSAILLAGCADKPVVKLDPKIAPPAIGEAGVLRIGVDLGYPPFAGTDEGRKAGLDIDVASAVAAELGLKTRFVDVPGDEVGEALGARTVDIALAGIPISEAVMSDVAFAGSYALDGPVLFASGEQTLTVAELGGKRVVAQQGSAAAWALEYELGAGAYTTVPTLRAALEAVASGTADVAAGDALVGAYIARDLPKVLVAGKIGAAVPVGIAVAKDSPELESAVRQALDSLATEGILETLRAKWAGSAPALRIDGATGAIEATAP
ncbi:MAG: ABC transporter substrate-binding protein [Coriobacteriia bacterium]